MPPSSGAALALVLLLMPNSDLSIGLLVSGYSSYRERIPNGYSVPSRGGYTFMAVGHNDAFKGGLPLNPFGKHFQAVRAVALPVLTGRPLSSESERRQREATFFHPRDAVDDDRRGRRSFG